MRKSTSVHLSHGFAISLIFVFLSATALAATLVWPQWIEALAGNQPDAGDGSEEWMMTALMSIAMVLSATGAFRAWRKGAAS
ncbi:hypothetical protein QFZ99_006112 [Paraburkholderia atlantica]|uniref:hypothetical protein n=1 Tax=Paraburkholderia atlantica TaxID=2654982 RepID=UPI003D2015DB